MQDRHESLGARFADFAGWRMPLQYEGVLAEHAAVREGAGIFDVSHLGTAVVSGEGAEQAVQRVLTNDLAKLGDGQAQYTLCCNASGGIVDDLIVYRRGQDDLLLVPNAANSAAVLDRVGAAGGPQVEVVDQHEDVAILAVQGPRADDVLAAVGLPAGHDYMSFVVADWAAPDGSTPTSAGVTVCRTGYTGERGYELMVSAEAVTALWDALLATAPATGLVPCGLGARDTLRTEMGYPLHGQDLSETVSPVQAGLSWAVGWKKPEFEGRQALLGERESGPARRLRGLRSESRSIPRPGMVVRDSSGEVGEVTSGTFSPTLRVGIGLALLDARVSLGDEVLVDVRGKAAPFTVVKPPFVTSSPLSPAR